MDPMIGTVMSALIVLAGRLVVLAALHIRLRAGERQERERGHTVVTLTRTLPPGSALEEVRGDGSRLSLRVAHPKLGHREPGAVGAAAGGGQEVEQ